MKELSIEEKAKRYDEAIKRASNLYKDAVEMENGMTTKTCEIIFPELKESEDEMIRKELITHCRNTRCVTEEGAERIAKWIAWLEKQKDRSTLSKDEEYTLARIIEYLEDNDCPSEWKDLLHDVYALPYQKEQKPWSEEDESMRQYVVNDLRLVKELVNDPNYAINVQLVEKEIDWMESLKERYTWKPSDERSLC